MKIDIKDHEEYFDLMKKIFEITIELDHEEMLRLFNAILALKKPLKTIQ